MNMVVLEQMTFYHISLVEVCLEEWEVVEEGRHVKEAKILFTLLSKTCL